MVFDTNLLLEHIRREEWLPARAIIPVVAIGELEALALRSSWGPRKRSFMAELVAKFPVAEVTLALVPTYALLDAYSQGRHPLRPLPPGLSARNMGKNDGWIAATALYFDLELHTNDRDFDHLGGLGLRLARR